MGREVDDAVVACAYPQAALPVLGHRAVVLGQSQRVYAPPLPFVGHVAQQFALGKPPQRRVAQSRPNVVAEGPRAGIEEIDAVEVVQPEQRVALPQSAIALGVGLHLVGLPIVTIDYIESGTIRQAEHALAIDQHLAVGQFHNLLHLARRQPVGHRPVALHGPSH